MARALFLTHDGLTDPLGGSQILPYLTGLARRGHAITIISAEKHERFTAGEREIRQQVEAVGIRWYPVPYRSRPPLLGTLLMLRQMERLALRLHREAPFQIVHARSYLASLLARRLKQRLGVRFLFDMRGFWADERRESGLWPVGHPLYDRVYRWFKAQEQGFYRDSDAMISLTEAGKRWIATQPAYQAAATPITVIPCTADFQHFDLQLAEERQAVRMEQGFGQDSLVLLYLGSLSPLYMLPEMLQFYAQVRAGVPDAWLWVLTPEPPELVQAEAARQGVPTDRIRIGFAKRAQLPRLLSAADASLCFIRPSFSKTASSPTKIGELLAMGIPVISNTGYGDIAELLQDSRLGILLPDFTPASLATAAAQVQPLAEADRLPRRQAAQQWYDLSLALERYASVYARLAQD